MSYKLDNYFTVMTDAELRATPSEVRPYAYRINNVHNSCLAWRIMKPCCRSRLTEEVI